MIASVSRSIFRKFSTEPVTKYTLPELKYGYGELEPVISSKLLEIHHKKHHNTYVTNLNNALEQFEGIRFILNVEAKENFDYSKMASLCQTIKFNLGGHINHSIYWKNLAPIGQGGGEFPDQ